MPPFNQGELLPARKASSAGSTDLAAGAEESVPKVLRSCIRTSQTSSYRISQLKGTEGFGMYDAFCSKCGSGTTGVDHLLVRSHTPDAPATHPAAAEPWLNF